MSVSVSDSKSGSDSIDVTIDVSNVNEAPTFTEGATATRTIAENTAAGVNIGDAVTATDVDANTTLAYTLGGTDASSFSIVGTTGQLQTSAALDYETKNSYSVTVSVSDSNSGRDSITVTIRVTATPFLPVNQRTPGVQREIVNVIRNINSADDVTKEHLAEITGLYFSNITSLKSGDFDGLTNLTTLSLSQNKLASLSSDVFDGLTNLTTLYL